MYKREVGVHCMVVICPQTVDARLYRMDIQVQIWKIYKQANRIPNSAYISLVFICNCAYMYKYLVNELTASTYST